MQTADLKEGQLVWLDGPVIHDRFRSTAAFVHAIHKSSRSLTVHAWDEVDGSAVYIEVQAKDVSQPSPEQHERLLKAIHQNL
jgi:hypothetical protein